VCFAKILSSPPAWVLQDGSASGVFHAVSASSSSRGGGREMRAA